VSLFIQPNWPAPNHVKAYTTLRECDSYLPFEGDTYVEESHKEKIKKNRTLLKNLLQFPEEPIWLQQTHSATVIKASPSHRQFNADASFADEKNQVCVVHTADCLPILLCDKKGTQVAAIHGGWRGLAKGIIQNTVQTLNVPSDELLVWLGPAICATHYEVGNEVRDIFIEKNAELAKAFSPSPQGRWLADLYAIARIQFQMLGVKNIFGGEFCTFEEEDLFFSYRREGKNIGRIATLIWIS